MKKLILLVLAIAFTFSSCEKDDICDANTITTPRLVISFYDISNSSVLKNVTNLSIIEENETEAVTFNSSTLINGSTVSIPLKTDDDVTKYRFILYFGSTTTPVANEDQIQFNYTRENVYVSRACGYKTEYTLDQANPFILTDGAAADQQWIKYLAVKKSTITNENETHLEIYF
ncbi:DUF6452 family protein [Flavobacterium frigidarium]|uniref:DUF6452 family protein n=1 Tax=Flavobacterium frigidarium TaxID=99286 RepID=UPI0030DD6BBB|tara:strand:- start:14982 stop:15503 length:522 start_codon:yes stop_codon:yes gene_type:complete